VLAALPTAIAHLPHGGSSISAPALLTRVQASAAVGYSGYAESTGSLALPVTTGQLSSVSDLFGSSTQLRVWWRGAGDWRVDQLSAAGEIDVHAAGADLWTWDYQSNTATEDKNATDVQARLPRADDLVPATLTRRLLAQATPGEVRRIATRSIAGFDAAGLRYVPAAPQSTIARIDVWALPGDGLPVAIEVYGKSATGDSSLVSATMLDLDTAAPSPSTTAFNFPADAKFRAEETPDLVSLADRLDGVQLPAELGGLARDSLSPTNSAVTVYGTGVTVLIAIPVFGRTGRQLHDELTKAVGTAKAAHGLTTSIGAVNLLLTDPVNLSRPATVDNGAFTIRQGLTILLVGTVTGPTLNQAAADLIAAESSGS
jgi:hypothetical protein